MQLYVGNTQQFFDDAARHTLADKLQFNFQRLFGYLPSVSEMRSWRNSLAALSVHLQFARLTNNGIILELQLPLSSARLDCLLTGRDSQRRDNAVIIELKQWDKAEASDVEECVITYLGGRDPMTSSLSSGEPLSAIPHRQPDRLHESDSQWAFQRAVISIILADPQSPLHAKKFEAVLSDCPMFAGNQAEELASYLRDRVSKDGGDEVLQRVLQSKYRASKKLLDHVAEVIQGTTFIRSSMSNRGL